MPWSCEQWHYYRRNGPIVGGWFMHLDEEQGVYLFVVMLSYGLSKEWTWMFKHKNWSPELAKDLFSIVIWSVAREIVDSKEKTDYSRSISLWSIVTCRHFTCSRMKYTPFEIFSWLHLIVILYFNLLYSNNTLPWNFETTLILGESAT